MVIWVHFEPPLLLIGNLRIDAGCNATVGTPWVDKDLIDNEWPRDRGEVERSGGRRRAQDLHRCRPQY